MLVLAMETSGTSIGISVARDEVELASIVFEHEMRLLERLVAQTERCLAMAGPGLAEVDLFAVDIGPGSFTGLRIGVTTAKMWAWSCAKPVLGISAPDILAAEHCDTAADAVVVLIRARYGSVYASEHTAGPTSTAVRQPTVVPWDGLAEWAAPLRGRRVLVCGDAAEGLVQAGIDLIGGCFSDVTMGRVGLPSASALARLARRAWQTGIRQDVLRLAPLYVAPPAIGPRQDAKRAGTVPAP